MVAQATTDLYRWAAKTIMAKVTKGLWNYTVNCDANHAHILLQALVTEGWTKTDDWDYFSPITSFWKAEIEKDGYKIHFDADDWFCDIIIPKKIWKELEGRITSLPM